MYPQETRLFQVSDSLLIFTCYALLAAVPAKQFAASQSCTVFGSYICSVAAEHRCLLRQKATIQMWGSAKCFLDFFFFIMCQPYMLSSKTLLHLNHYRELSCLVSWEKMSQFCIYLLQRDRESGLTLHTDCSNLILCPWAKEPDMHINLMSLFERGAQEHTL